MNFNLPKGKYGTLVVDPPWSFNDKGSRASPDWNRNTKYRTLTPADLADLDVPRITAPKAHLYLWTTDAHLPIALDLMTAWGFRYTQTLTWLKLTKTGKPYFGMGHYYRHSHELVLFGVKGSCPAKIRNLRSVFEAENLGHSTKPEILQDMAEQLSPGPRIELFARRHRNGWTCFGDQLPTKKRRGAANGRY